MDVSIVVYMFIGSIKIGSSHKINISDEDIKKDFTSNPPIYTVSTGAVNFQKLVVTNAEVNFNFDYDTSPLIYDIVMNTDLESNHKAVYKALEMTCLESMTIQYALNSDETYLKDIYIDDLNRVRRNLRILADWLGGYDSYQFLVEFLRDNEIALGYAQNKIDIQLNGITLREDTK